MGMIGVCGIPFEGLVVKTSCSMKDHFMFVLAGGLQGDNPDPDGDVSCKQAALSLLINSSLHTGILYLKFRPSCCCKKLKKFIYLPGDTYFLIVTHPYINFTVIIYIYRIVTDGNF